MYESGIFDLSPNELGKFGEEVAKRFLRKHGFKVRPFGDLLRKKKPCSKAKSLAEICSENCHLAANIFGISVPKENYHCKRLSDWVWWDRCIYNLYKFCPKVCKRFCRPRNIFQIKEDNKAFGLDYVAYKDGKQYAVEVKTGTHAELKRSQRELAECLKQKFGIESIQIHVVLGNTLSYQVEAEIR
jgi:hypothetical protein